MNKYEFVESDKIEFDGRVLTRTRALVDIPQFNVKAGDLGGYIEKESNLSHEGNCWVGGNARVLGNAFVFGNACVYGNAEVYGIAQVSGNACVFGNACVYGDAQVFDNARVYGYAWVYGNAQVYSEVHVLGNARVFGDALIFDKAKVSGNAHISGSARVPGNAKIESNDDFIVLGPAKSSGRYTTAYKTQDSKIRVRSGCFAGTPDEFLAKINKTHSNNEEFRNQYLDFHKQILEKFADL